MDNKAEPDAPVNPPPPEPGDWDYIEPTPEPPKAAKVQNPKSAKRQQRVREAIGAPTGAAWAALSPKEKVAFASASVAMNPMNFPATVTQFEDGWVYVGQQKQFVRRKDGKMWDVDAFEKQFGYVRLKLFFNGKCPATFSKHLLDNRLLPTFDSFAFAPGKPENYKGDFNQWRPSPIKPKQGDTKIWDAHMAYMFADEAARNRVLNWMAWTYQNPTLHPNHSIVVFGRIQGTGKTLLPLTLAKLQSALPATPLSQLTLELSHAAWPLRTKLAIVEVRSSNAKLTNILHDLITGQSVHVDMKGAHDFDMPNVIAYWIETNKPNALAGLDDSDRRHMIETTDGKTPLQPQSQSYYDMLYPAILDNPEALSAIAYALQTRDLKGYSGLHRAPSTAAKKSMMEDAADDVQKWMIEHADEVPLSRTLVTVDEIFEALPNDIRRKTGARGRVAEVLRDQFNGESLGRVRLGGRGEARPNLWAIHKTRPDVSVRDTLKDADLARIYKGERWEASPAEKAAAAKRLSEAQAEFAADKWE